MAHFDRFDIVMAHYVFYAHFHEGQWSDKYRRLCHIGEYFKPGAAGIDLDREENENAREIYLSLLERHGYEYDGEGIGF